MLSFCHAIPRGLGAKARVPPGRAQEAGVDLAQVDWMVCNGGADIWLLLPAREGKKEATWAADEQWDSHISFRCARCAGLHTWRSAMRPKDCSAGLFA